MEIHSDSSVDRACEFYLQQKTSAHHQVTTLL